MIWLVLGIVVFLGVHSVRMVAPGLRERVIAERGEGTWKGIYSVVSLVGFVLLVWGFGQARMGAPILWTPPVWLAHINLLLMLIALIVLASYAVPTGHIKRAAKHPMILAVKIWALGHLLANGDLASLILFGSFLAWGVWNRISLKRRGAPDHGEPALRNDVIAVVIGTAVYVWLLLQGHQWLFGVPPIA
ncbi:MULTISPECIES: NnrU family protein [unclassified Roseitalea]|uniref:NnrU family protein n=1 Tax=unclassified Roseitalea TaxID=2639107 RepID=UPI00273E8428|nr:MULTISPECIES: NnrU family protein [unclassified Roseitalea]